MMYDNAGSKSYKAPEIGGRGGYTPAPTDSWSTGVMLFTLYSGFFPFEMAQKRDQRFDIFHGDTVVDGLSACTSLFEMNGVPERLRDLRSSRHGREFEDMITKLLTVAWR